MKNILKSFFLFAILVSSVSCDDGNDAGISNEELGWVQFINDKPVVTADQVYDTELTVDISIQVPKTNSDLAISYDLIPVSGLDPNAVFSNNGVTIAPAGLTSWSGPDNSTGIDYAYLAGIDFNLTELPLLTEDMVFDVVLTATDSPSVEVGLNNEKLTTTRVMIGWKYLNTLSFTGDSFSIDLGIPPGGLVDPYQINLVPVEDQVSTWTTSTVWGPQVVSGLTADPSFEGQFLNASTITLNDDDSITVTGTNGPGTGAYNPTSGDIIMNMTQNIFTTPFTIDVLYTAN